MIEGHAPFFRDRKASVEGHARRILSSAREHQGDAQGRLKMHFVESAVQRGLQSEKRPLGPSMAFGQQRHGQKHRRGRHRKSNADFGVAVNVETPLQGGADIIDAGKVRDSLRASRQGCPVDPVCSSHRR